MLNRAALTLFLALGSGLFGGQDKDFKALVDTMRNDLSDSARQAAAISVLSHPENGALDVIEEFLKTEEGAAVRQAVCSAIGASAAYRENPQATLLLTQLLTDDPNAEVRLAALHGLESRQDRRALGSLKIASERDADSEIRKRAKKAYSALQPQKAKKTEAARYDAVKGRDHCGNGNGWCECGSPALTLKARCIPRADCSFKYENTYRRQGFTCTWDSLSLE